MNHYKLESIGNFKSHMYEAIRLTSFEEMRCIVAVDNILKEKIRSTYKGYGFIDYSMHWTSVEAALASLGINFTVGLGVADAILMNKWEVFMIKPPMINRKELK